MLIRLGRVVWWFGALLMAVGVILAVSALPYLKKDARTEMLARQLDAVQSQIDRMNQTLTASPALPPNLQWLNQPLPNSPTASAPATPSVPPGAPANTLMAEVPPNLRWLLQPDAPTAPAPATPGVAPGAPANTPIAPHLPPNLQWLNQPLNSKLQTRAEELQNQISAIQSRRIAAEDKLLSGLLLLAFAVACWAVSYVLGGRFWLPPSGAPN